MAGTVPRILKKSKGPKKETNKGPVKPAQDLRSEPHLLDSSALQLQESPVGTK